MAEIQQLQFILLQLLPADYSVVGNISLWAHFQAATQAAAIPAISDDDFKAGGFETWVRDAAGMQDLVERHC